MQHLIEPHYTTSSEKLEMSYMGLWTLHSLELSSSNISIFTPTLTNQLIGKTIQ